MVRLDIIATAYRSTAFTTHVFRLDSQLCIDIATDLHTVYLDWLQAAHESKSKCAWKCRSTELGDTLRGRDRATWHMTLEAVIEHIWRFTWRPWLCELAGLNLTGLEIHMHAVIKRVWRSTWRPWSGECGDTLGCRDRASLDEDFAVVNGRVHLVLSVNSWVS